MHEASAAEAIVRLIGETLSGREGAAQAGSQPIRVKKIRLVVGESAGYMKESLAFYLDTYGKGTPVEGAALDIEYVKARFHCESCGSDYRRERFSFDCPLCGGRGRLVSVGSDFYIDSIEIEEPPRVQEA